MAFETHVIRIQQFIKNTFVKYPQTIREAAKMSYFLNGSVIKGGGGTVSCDAWFWKPKPFSLNVIKSL